MSDPNQTASAIPARNFRQKTLRRLWPGVADVGKDDKPTDQNRSSIAPAADEENERAQKEKQSAPASAISPVTLPVTVETAPPTTETTTPRVRSAWGFPSAFWSPSLKRQREPEKEASVEPKKQRRLESSRIRPAGESDDSEESDSSVIRVDSDANHEDDKRWEIESIVDARPLIQDRNRFELLVRWSSADGHKNLAETWEETWEPEDVIQEDAPSLVAAYWNGVSGGRTSRMEEKDLWYILHILDHRHIAHPAKKEKTAQARGRRGGRGVKTRMQKRTGTEYLVEWVGSDEHSWEPESVVEEAMPQLLKDYWSDKYAVVPVVARTISKRRGNRKSAS